MVRVIPAVKSADGTRIEPLTPPDAIDLSNAYIGDLASKLIPDPPDGSGLMVDGDGFLALDPEDAVEALAPVLAESTAILPKRMTKAEWDGLSASGQAAVHNAIILESGQIVAWVMGGVYNELGRALVS